MSAQYETYSMDGKVVYCIEPGIDITTTSYLGYDGLQASPYSAEISKKIELIGHYGYDYPGHQTLRYRMAAQALIWETTGGQIVEFWTQASGYGDYIKGDHVYLYEGGPRYFKFYETSKIGCKDAIDKKSCANWYINDLTPRLASVKDNLETWQNQYDAEVRRLEEAQKKVTELEDEILNYNPEDNYTPLEDLKTSLEHYKTVVEGATSGKKEAQDYVKAINLEIEEYNKVLAVYYAVLN